MQFQYSPYIIPLIIAAGVSGLVAIYSWTRRSTSGSAAALAIMGAVITEWSLGYALEIAGADLPTKLIWGKSQYVAIVLTPLIWLIFAYNHANRGKTLSPRTIVLLAIEPLITLILALTTDTHHLIWRDISIQQTGSFSALHLSYGPWFWVHWVYSYVLLMSGTVIVLRLVWSRQGLYRRQAVALLVAVLAPWVGNFLYTFKLSPVPSLDLTPFGFTLSVAALAWALFGYQLIRIAPIARDMVVEEMVDGMIVIDDQGQVVDINQSAQQMIGLAGLEVIGKSAAEVFKPWPDLVQKYSQVREARDEISIGEGKDRRWFELRLSPFYDRGQHYVGRVIILQDTTSRKQAEERFDQLARQQQMILDNIPVGVIFEKDQDIVWANRMAEAITGYSAHQMKTLRAPMYYADLDSYLYFTEQINQPLKRTEQVRVEVPLKRKDGSRYWGNIIGRSIKPTQAGEEILWVLEDVTARRQAEEQLRIRWRAVEASPASIIITDTNGNIQYVNPKFSQVTGYGLQEAVGKNPRILKTDQTSPEVHRQLWRTISSGHEWSGEFCNRKKNGELFWEAASISPVADPTGRITHYVAVQQDITEQRQLQAQLRSQNEYLSILHQITLDLLNRRDLNDLLQSVVDRAAVLLDAPFGEIMIKEGGGLYVRAFTTNQPFLLDERVGQDMNKLSWQAYETRQPLILADYSSWPERPLPREEVPLHALAMFPVMAGDLCLAVLGVGRSEPDFPFSPEITQTGNLFAQLVALVLDNANLYDSALKDIADRKRAEALLQESETRYRQIVESASDIIYRTDANGCFTYVNPTAMRMMGYEEINEILGKHYLDMVAVEARHAVKRFYQRQVLSGEVNTYHEFPALSTEGQEVWLGQNVQIIKNKEARITGFQAVARNITEIKRAQEALAIARDQALEASRLKSQLLASISHELRTPLSGILGYAELLHENAFGLLEEKQKQATSHIIDSTRYLNMMISELLDQAQIEAKALVLRLAPFSSRQMLEQVEANMKVLAQNKGLQLITHVSPTLPENIYNDEQRLQQILINLIGNAIKFTKSGQVRVELFQPDVTHWGMRVSDTGVGIPQESLSQIFEPFRKLDNSLTRSSPGTGLGLSITKQLVEMMEGKITVESEVGRGSIFTVVLPLIIKTPEAGEIAGMKPFALIVEDDPKLGQIYATALQEAGFEAEIDAQGDQVMGILGRKSPALIVLDLHMPFASGADILAGIRSDRRLINTPVIVATADLFQAKSFESLVQSILIKPVSVGRLREVAMRLCFGSVQDQPTL